MGNFLSNLFGNLFSVKNSDGTINKPTLLGFAGMLLTTLMVTEGGPEFLNTALNGLGAYKPLALALFAMASGAAANTKPE